MVKLIHDGGEIDLDLTDKKTTLGTLKDLIAPGEPVLVESINHNPAFRYIYPETNRDLFIFGGNISDDLHFSQREINGRTVTAHASHARKERDWGMEGFDLRLNHEPPKVIAPYNSSQTRFNEGTFSPAGGVSWTEYHWGGPVSISIGKTVKEKCAPEIRAIEFAEKAYVLKIPFLYSSPGSLVRQAGKTDDEKRKFEIESARLSEVSAAKSLVELANRTLRNNNPCPDMHRDLQVVQVGYYHSGEKMFTEKGYPVSKEDYAINELSHPGRLVGFVKVGRSNGTLIYSTDWAKNVMDLAFSKEFVKRYFPGSDI